MKDFVKIFFDWRELKKTFKVEMGDLKSMTYPQMLSKFRERRNESKILLPLMSHLPQNCPTLHTARKCQLILKKCLKQWLTPKTGVLVIVHMSDSLDENGRTINVMQNLHRYFSDKMELLMEAKDVKSYLEKSGDVQGIKKALHAVVPDGIGSYIAELMIVRKK
ncbi:hypothetical protein HELRODRAFT_190250 [Helobdella robusta]|uniref:Uncharacterized protein n=1 Tax=Helobdella robusta TaxID=6412 RepID=T1FRT4_HELRO|nr:hypothetical protein HELRODRAFT_190250 [Helobdella robusta]ESO10965.1 hypothetical protein HELRODRAFT_190250 [Helobdella robusta]